jgi:Holliday junction resolvase RusA-like endonuclease
LERQTSESSEGGGMKIILPFSVTLPRKTKDDKVFNLNLNIYRNTHHMVLNQAKIAWKEIVRTAVGRNLITGPPYAFTYTAYPASNRKFDLGNVLSIIQKFTDDALIEMNVINDDSYKVIPVVSYKFGRVDKENPRVELEINTVDSKNLPF